MAAALSPRYRARPSRARRGGGGERVHARRGLLRGWVSWLLVPNHHRRLRGRSLVRAEHHRPILVTLAPRPHPLAGAPASVDVARSLLQRALTPRGGTARADVRVLRAPRATGY